MKLIRKILFPFVPFYYLATYVRNWLYNTGTFKSKAYDLPIICVGNLSVGGTGKSPMVEYIIKQLKDTNRLATLSRGYKRKTEGFVIADQTANSDSIGDEPLQFYTKFNDITVAVDADRQHGISELLNMNIETIILDDAFQHRKVNAGLNILLTTYNQPYFDDYVLPTGNLREPRSGAKRADIIIVTKCPDALDDISKKEMIKNINPHNGQFVFFSHIQYNDMIVSSTKEEPLSTLKQKPFTLVTGIANASPLVYYLKAQGLAFEHLNYGDHHDFNVAEIELLKEKDLILTTEKDYMRLKDKLDNLCYLPIETVIEEERLFNKRIQDFVIGFKTQ